MRVRARVLPGYEDSWSRVLVALDDVTERVAAQRLRDESAIYARSLFCLLYTSPSPRDS